MGAGWCALRIHNALLSVGVDSKVLVAEKHSTDPLVFEMLPNGLNQHKRSKNPLIRKTMTFLRSIGLFRNKKDKTDAMQHKIHWNTSVTWFSPITNYDVLKSPLVQEADIIHLHWVAGFLDYETFFAKINKPIVWTLHDQNIALGGFHYMRDKLNNYQCCKVLEDYYSGLKQKAIRGNNKIYLIALSEMMQQFLKSQAFLQHCTIVKIHNSVDATRFRVINREFAREVFGIAKNFIVFAFCAYRLFDERKGLRDLIKAIENLKDDNIALLCIGGGTLPVETRVPVYCTGEIGNDSLMALAYSAANYFAMPSYQEVFAQTPMEAMACGLPVVAYPCSGASDLINETNGIVCDDFTEEALCRGIKRLLSVKYDEECIRRNMEVNYSPVHIARQYLDVYKEFLD